MKAFPPLRVNKLRKVSAYQKVKKKIYEINWKELDEF